MFITAVVWIAAKAKLKRFKCLSRKMDYRSADITYFGFDGMMNRVDGNICGVQSLLFSAVLHALILVVVVLNSGSRIDQHHGVGHFRLVLLEMEQQNSLDIVEVEPKLASAQITELGASEPDLVSVLKALPIVANELAPDKKLPLFPDSHTLDRYIYDDNAPDDLNREDFMISAPRGEYRSFINHRESKMTAGTASTDQTSAPKIQSKREKTGHISSASNTDIEHERHQAIEVEDKSDEAVVPVAKSKLEFSKEESSKVVVAAGSRSPPADPARQTMQKLLGKQLGRFEGPQSSMANVGACKTRNSTAVNTLPNTDVISANEIILGNENIRISDLLGGVNFGFLNNSGMTINHLLNNLGNKTLNQKPSDAISISWLLSQQKISKAVKCE